MRKSLLMGLCMVFLVVLVSSIVSAEVTLDEQWQKVNTNTLNLIVDDLGNTYGLVWTYDFIDNTYFIVKYDVDGNQLWNTPLPVDSNNYWTSMQIDSNGNVYVAGRRSDSRSIRAKLSSNGVLEWKKTGPINFESRFVVQNDVPYLLRYSRAYPVIQHARFFLVNSVTGDVNKLFDFGYIGDDLRVYSRFLTATNSGDFYALNYFYGGQVDRLIKFDVAGNILWDNVLSQLSEYSFYSMDVDSQDNVYIVYDNLDGVNGMNLVKYDSNGNQLWVKENVLSSAHVDENDNIFTFDMDDNVEKYNSDGVLLWETLVPEPMLSTLNALQAGTYNYNIYIGRAISHNGDLLFHTIMHDDFAGSYVESNIIKYNILGECVCSDTFCNPVHDGTVCDGCNYVAAPVEVCGDGVDNDCDGVVDDGCGMETCIDPPFDIDLVIDTSTSMKTKMEDVRRIDVAVDAANLFLDNIFVNNLGNYVGVTSFDTNADEIYPLSDYTHQSNLKDSLNDFNYGDATRYDRAITFSVDKLLSQGRVDIPNVIVFLSDGDPSGSSWMDGVYYANDSNVSIYTVGIGEASEDILGIVASITEGSFASASSSEELNAIYERLSTEFCYIPDSCECSNLQCFDVQNNPGVICDGCNYVAASVEVCGNGVDDDCDGVVDYDDSDCPCDYTFIIWQDLDGDGHGDSTVSREVCVIFGDIFIPEPVPTCADGIEYCLTSGDCIANGYYWYNDICNVVPEPTCADGIEYCLTSGDCIANGYYWYDDICNVVPEPTCADGIEYCLTSGDCITNGYYWYDNDCHTVPEPVPTCADGVVYCLTSGDCIANGYYWYDNDCHAVPEPLICCNPGPSADNRDYDICQGGSIVLGCNSKSTQYDQAAAIANCIASRTKYDSSLPLSTWIYACETNWDYHYCSDITRTGSPVEPYCMVQEAAD